MTLSIIIPLYNCKRFIGKCIKSCLNQGLENDDYEIIVVNDASTDGGENKVVSLSESFSNIHLINHKVNLGPEQSRLTGFLSSNGRFVFFIDCDDWLEPAMYATMIRTLEEQQADIIICGYIEEYATRQKHVNADGALTVYDAQDALKLVLATHPEQQEYD